MGTFYEDVNVQISISCLKTQPLVQTNNFQGVTPLVLIQLEVFIITWFILKDSCVLVILILSYACMFVTCKDVLKSMQRCILCFCEFIHVEVLDLFPPPSLCRLEFHLMRNFPRGRYCNTLYFENEKGSMHFVLVQFNKTSQWFVQLVSGLYNFL